MSAVNAIESSVLEAAERLRPELSDRRREIDEARQLPQDLAEQLAALSFYRLVVPESARRTGSRLRSSASCVELSPRQTALQLGASLLAQPRSTYLVPCHRPSFNVCLKIQHVTSGVFADSGTALFEERNGSRLFD